MARPSEIKAVAAAISEPAETAEEAAKRAIAALDESRQDRVDYLVCRRWGNLVDAWGPYATRNQAEKAIEKRTIPAIDGTRFYVIPVYNPKRALDAWEQADRPAIGEAALKLWEIARNGGQPARTHSRRNRRRAS